MTLVTLGPAGTFSHELAARLDPDVRLCSSIAAVFSAVGDGEGDGLVPLENSEAGSVGATLVGLADHPVSITGECTIPIRHHLAATDPTRELERVYAHPQTAEQCSRRLDALGLPVVPTASNAASAIAARDDPSGGRGRLGRARGAVRSRRARTRLPEQRHERDPVRPDLADAVRAARAVPGEPPARSRPRTARAFSICCSPRSRPAGST